MIMACIVHKVDRATSTGFKRMEGNKNGQKENWLMHLQLIDENHVEYLLLHNHVPKFLPHKILNIIGFY